MNYIVIYITPSSLHSGLRSAGQMHASFTSDGKHIVSVSEDSNVCVWNYTGQDRGSSKAKKIWSSECFLSHNAAIAIPWCGMESMPGTLLSPSLRDDFNHKSFLSSPDCFFLSRGFLSELVPKVSPTWPEETLVDSSQAIVSPKMCKSEYKFLKSACKGMSNSHLWGQVIVTAGWDGHIRVYQNYGLPVRVWNQCFGSLWCIPELVSCYADIAARIERNLPHCKAQSFASVCNSISIVASAILPFECHLHRWLGVALT